MNKLGKYQIRRTLGKGAMGIVYEGFDPVIERTVAINHPAFAARRRRVRQPHWRGSSARHKRRDG